MASKGSKRKGPAETVEPSVESKKSRKASEKGERKRESSTTPTTERRKKTRAEDGAEESREGAEGPKWEKEKAVPQNHKEQKELKLKRKMLRNPHFDLVAEAKIEWEKARSRRVSPKERSDCVSRIVEKVKGRMMDVILQHDSVRVIQTCMQYGTAEERECIVTELEPHTLALATAAYGKFMIQKMLVYGSSKQRNMIIARFYGSVRKLIKHRHAAAVLALAYADYATPDQRASLLLEFYGPKYALFKGKGKTKSLDQILDQHPDKKGKILEHLKSTLTPLLEKGLCAHNIVHRALYNYLRYIPSGAPEFLDMLESIKELLVEMVHTKDGAKIAMHCLWGADAKARKVIVRSFKPFVTKVCKEEDGHMALFALFDSVDDTVLVNKSILNPMIKDVDEIGIDKVGAKVFLYLLSPRSHKYFNEELRKFLETGDEMAVGKKSLETKQAELRAAVIAPLAEFATRNASTLVGEGLLSQLLFEIICAQAPGSPELTQLLKAVVATARDGTITPLESEEGSSSAIEPVEGSLMGHAVGHRFAKKLLDTSNAFAAEFASLLFSELEDRVEELTQHNRACFVLLSILEGNFPLLHSDISSLLRKANLESRENLSTGGRIIVKVLGKLEAQTEKASVKPKASKASVKKKKALKKT